jgi:DNA (cytosine-5)-methyltransferase 1
VLVMENVAGLVTGKMRLVFAEIMRALKGSGYLVSTRRLNAMYFGVPQSRQRLIFLGVREDLGIAPSHPKAQTWPIPVREALEGVAYEPVPGLTPKYRDLAPRVRPGQCAADIDAGTGFQNLVRLRWDKPAPTINRMNPGTGLGTPLHPTEHRSLSIPEAKRLCSFPDEFVLPDGTFPQRWGVLGNAVPPLFMRAIALHITETILTSGDTP